MLYRVSVYFYNKDLVDAFPDVCVELFWKKLGLYDVCLGMFSHRLYLSRTKNKVTLH